MATKKWSSFYKGLSKDDYITQEGTYLYGNNIDGSIFGYGATISRKGNKLISTTHPIYDIGGNLESSDDDRKIMVGHDGTDGYIYNFNSADNTAEVTVATSDTTYNLLTGCPFNGYYYFLGYGTADSTRYALHHSVNSALSMSYNTNTDANFGVSYIPDYSIAKSLLMIAGTNRVWTLPSSSTTVTERSAFSGEVTGIEESGTTILVYTDRNRVYIWDGVSNSTTGSKILEYNVLKTGSTGNIIYGTTDTGSIMQGNGFSFAGMYEERKTKKSDVSTYYDILDFSSGIDDNTQGNSIESVDGHVYFIEGGKRIAKLSSVRPDVAPGIHTILSHNHNNDFIDKIYCIRRSRGKLYYSYKSGSNYGVDYIDVTDLSSHESGTIITPVFRSEPDTESKIKDVKITFSNTSGVNKGLHLYVRINGGSWQTVRNFNNESTDDIQRKVIRDITNQFVDIQFKAVLTNTDQDDSAPILHSISLDYTVIKQ